MTSKSNHPNLPGVTTGVGTVAWKVRCGKRRDDRKAHESIGERERGVESRGRQVLIVLCSILALFPAASWRVVVAMITRTWRRVWCRCCSSRCRGAIVWRSYQTKRSGMKAIRHSVLELLSLS